VSVVCFCGKEDSFLALDFMCVFGETCESTVICCSDVFDELLTSVGIGDCSKG